MSRVIEQDQFSTDICSLILWVKQELGWMVTHGEAWRPVEMQKIYVQTGRSKTMLSSHIDRLAQDLNFFAKDGTPIVSAEAIAPVGRKWEGMNPKNRWGGSWRGLVEAGKSKFVDAPHFERQV